MKPDQPKPATGDALADHVAGIQALRDQITALEEQLAAEREKFRKLEIVTHEAERGWAKAEQQLAAEREKLQAALKLLHYAKDSISVEDHVKMGLVLVRIRDSGVPEIAAIWKESEI